MVVLAQEDRAVVEAARGDGVVAAGHHGAAVVAHRTGVDGQVARSEDHAGVTGGGLRSRIAIAAAALAARCNIRAVALANRGRRCGLVDQAIGGIDRDRTGLRLDRPARVGDGGRRDQNIPGRGDGAGLIGQLGKVGGQRTARHDAGDLLLGVNDVVRRAVPRPGGGAEETARDRVGTRRRIPHAAGQRRAIDQLLADIVDRTAQRDVAGRGDLPAIVERADLRQVDVAAGGNHALLAGDLLDSRLRGGRRGGEAVHTAGAVGGVVQPDPMRLNQPLGRIAIGVPTPLTEHAQRPRVEGVPAELGRQLPHEGIQRRLIDRLRDGLGRARRGAVVQRADRHAQIAGRTDPSAVVGQGGGGHRQVSASLNDAGDPILRGRFRAGDGRQRDERCNLAGRCSPHRGGQLAKMPQFHRLAGRTVVASAGAGYVGLNRRIGRDHATRAGLQIADRDWEIEWAVLGAIVCRTTDLDLHLLLPDHDPRQIRRIDLLPRHHGRAGTARDGRIIDDLAGGQTHVAPRTDRAPLVQHTA